MIALLGRHAMHRFFPDMKISEVHGKSFKKDGIEYITLYHPAAALYNGGLRETLMSDFQNIKNAISSS